MQPRLRDVPANRVALKMTSEGAMLALLRAGTRARRVGVALVVVVGGFALQSKAEALSVSERDVLYLDAPAVSEERAERAGEVAASLPTAGSAESETLAWLAVAGVPARTDMVPGSVARALASVTARDGAGEGGVTPSDAVLAGEVMVAQLGEPPVGGEGDGDEFASSEAVRPRLGDEPAAEEGSEPAGSESAERDGQPGGIEYASIEEPSAYAPAPLGSAPVIEPDGGAGVTLPAPARDEESSPSPRFVYTPDETAAILPPDAEAGGEPPEIASLVFETPVDEPPEAGTSIEGPAENPEPEPGAPDAGPTGLEEEGFALAPASGTGEDVGGPVPTEEIPRSGPAPPSDEGERAEDGPAEAPPPGGILAADEASETTSTETSTEATGQRVEVVAIDETASTADTRPSDEFPSEPEVGEAPPTGIQEPAEDREPTPEGITEASQSEGRGLHAEEERLPAGDPVGVPEQTMSDEGFRVPERPRSEERVERREAGDRSDRDRRGDAADRLARIRSADGGGEAVQEDVSDLAGASGGRGAADEPEPAPETVVRSGDRAPRAPYLRSDVLASREASGETALRGERPAPDGGAVERRSVVVSRESPEREAVRAQQTVEPPSEPSAAHRTTDKTRQGGRR